MVKPPLARTGAGQDGLVTVAGNAKCKEDVTDKRDIERSFAEILPCGVGSAIVANVDVCAGWIGVYGHWGEALGFYLRDRGVVGSVAFALLEQVVRFHSSFFLSQVHEPREGGFMDPADALIAADEIGSDEEDDKSDERGGNEESGFADGPGDRNGTGGFLA